MDRFRPPTTDSLNTDGMLSRSLEEGAVAISVVVVPI
jgi:hypothetical protein